jgi:methylglutaconyl-CoA hydratase
MEYSSITLSASGRSAVVTLDRPEKRNALDGVMIRELTQAFKRLDADKQARVVVLTGSGTAFCAGMDLAYLRKRAKSAGLTDARALMKLLRLISGLKKPVIAMVNGPAVGGGCGLAAACDFVFASREKASFGTPEVKLGFLPAIILTYLIRRMGESSAKEFVIAGEMLDAASAKARGLVSEIAPHEKLPAQVLSFAAKLAATASPGAVAMIKEMFTRAEVLSTAKGYEYAAKMNAAARTTADFKKGLASFLAGKRIEW